MSLGRRGVKTNLDEGKRQQISWAALLYRQPTPKHAKIITARSLRILFAAPTAAPMRGSWCVLDSDSIVWNGAHSFLINTCRLYDNR